MSKEINEFKVVPVSVSDLKTKLATLETQLAAVMGAVAEVEERFDSSGPHELRTPEIDERVIRRLLRARRLRENIFGPNIFADPAWDILLEAYAAHLGQRRISVSEACSVSAVPATTALRWLNKLEEEGWLEREVDPLDGQQFWLALTDAASSRLRTYFEAVWPSLFLL